jgi:hypothetical protein
VVCDYDKLYRMAHDYADRRPRADGTVYDADELSLAQFVQEAMDEAFASGRDSVYQEGAARAALLDGQASWLDQADEAKTPTERAVAVVIADAFGRWADALRATPHASLDTQQVAPALTALTDPTNVYLVPVEDELVPPGSALGRHWAELDRQTDA